jgi:triosephosphate isomerase
MYKAPVQASDYIALFWAPAEALTPRCDIVLCAPFVDLETLRVDLAPSSVKYGAQDCFWEPEGAYTGEISAKMLADIGCSYCIVGHSERRQYFHETDEDVARKTSALLACGITPIVCVGETLEEKQQGKTLQRIGEQVRNGLGHLSDEQRSSIVVAYEPVWCIGTGMADDPVGANATIGAIRQIAGGLADARMLYGGSMNPNNAAMFSAQPNVDGGLVGSASLDARNFIQLIISALK